MTLINNSVVAVASGGLFFPETDTSGAVFPAEAEVELGVDYGPTGADYTGSLTVGAGTGWIVSS